MRIVVCVKEVLDPDAVNSFAVAGRLLIGEDGTGLEQVTQHPEFDSFPVFSPDGRYLVFASNRFGAKEGDTNIFVAEWVD